MSTDIHIYKSEKPIQLERGGELKGVQIAYHTFGQMNEKKDNVVWVFHALTASSNCLDWWANLFTDHSTINAKKHFIVCANILGSPYGSTSPLSINPDTGKEYYTEFPLITIRDMVEAHKLLRTHLGIEKIAIGIGGSMGGFQTYEWAAQEPDLFNKLILIGTAPKESPWRISIHASQRMAIETDPTWREHNMTAGANGVAVSRAIGMLSYRNHLIFEKTQADEEEKVDNYRADSYMRYQGQKLANRNFQGFLLWSLTKALDSHDIGRGRGGVEKVLSELKPEVLQIAINSDLLFPVDEQQRIKSHIPKVTYVEIDSLYGHDGFLTEADQIDRLIAEFI